MSDRDEKDDDRDREIVWGARAIGEVIGRPERATFHMLENGRLPAKRVGKMYAGERGRLRAAVIGEGR